MRDRNVPTPLHFPPNSSKALPNPLPSQSIPGGTETFRGCPHEGAWPRFGDEGVGLGRSWDPPVLSPPSPRVLLPPARACHPLLHLGTPRWLFPAGLALQHLPSSPKGTPQPCWNHCTLCFATNPGWALFPLLLSMHLTFILTEIDF